MLLFKIDPQRLAIFPLERDAPLGPATAVTGSRLPRFYHCLPRQAPVRRPPLSPAQAAYDVLQPTFREARASSGMDHA